MDIIRTKTLEGTKTSKNVLQKTLLVIRESPEVTEKPIPVTKKQIEITKSY